MSKLKINLDDWHEDAQKEDPVDIAAEDMVAAADWNFAMLDEQASKRTSTPDDISNTMRKHPELVSAHAIAHAINRLEHTYRTLKIEDLRLKVEELRLMKDSIYSTETNGTTLYEGDKRLGMSVDDMLTENFIDIQGIFDTAIEAFYTAMNGHNRRCPESPSREEQIEMVRQCRYEMWL